ncbi:DUF397 domain-containing protein [Streptomyces sp. NA04227]|uniref:DUF397 domain-containing protein n=1 Tax=Streptomyces sp. NA04227 TaxID=2742136 RepID=UPI0015903EF0|nr:DUF397 domain-containing protein [Streptomyces sp. NA04227]QKW06687.1 DUF397 domain-containing protein [Streptomyces sp. NA04227]
MSDELAWFKSSHSGTQGDNCIEVALTEHTIHVRDSKDTTRSPFAVQAPAWTRFLEYAAQG